MKKEYTEQYIDENFAEIMNDYMKDEDTFKLINAVNKIDENALPIILHFIQIHYMTKMINEMTELLENKDNDFIDQLIENRDLIDGLAKITELNTPPLIVKKGDFNGFKKSK